MTAAVKSRPVPRWAATGLTEHVGRCGAYLVTDAEHPWAKLHDNINSVCGAPYTHDLLPSGWPYKPYKLCAEHADAIAAQSSEWLIRPKL